MCTELSLALLYFFTIFAVNFFLFKVLKSYFENIMYLTKIKNVFSSFTNKKDLELVSIIYSFLKKDTKTRNKMIFFNFINLQKFMVVTRYKFINILKHFFIKRNN